MNNSTTQRTVLFVVALSFFLAAFMGSSINIALPSIGRELQMDAVSLGWVATAYILVSCIFLLPFGRLGDIHGRKKMITCGLFFYIISSTLLSLAPSGTALIALRAVQGVGGAMIFSSGVAIVTSVFPSGKRGSALGITTAVTYMGLSLGPVLGGLLTQHFGWRSVFWAAVPLSILALLLLRFKVKEEWADARGEGFNITGAIIYGLALTGIIYGFSLLPTLTGILLVIGGGLGIFAFIKQESKVKYPMLDIDLFRNNRVFAFSNLAVLLNYSAAHAVSFLMSLYLQYIKGLNPQSAGLVLIAMPAMQAIFSPIAGRLSDRIEPRKLSSVGMGLIALGLAFFTNLGDATDLNLIIGILILLGFGFAFFSSPNTNAIMNSVTEKFYGVASATMATMRQIGMMFSLGIAMMLIAVNIGRVEISPDYYPAFLESIRIAFIIFTILCGAGIFASMARGNTRKHNTGG